MSLCYIIRAIKKSLRIIATPPPHSLPPCVRQLSRQRHVNDSAKVNIDHQWPMWAERMCHLPPHSANSVCERTLGLYYHANCLDFSEWTTTLCVAVCFSFVWSRQPLEFPVCTMEANARTLN